MTNISAESARIIKEFNNNKVLEAVDEELMSANDAEHNIDYLMNMVPYMETVELRQRRSGEIIKKRVRKA